MLNDITEFEIVPEYKIRGTTYWVMVPGVAEPIARIRRDVSITGSIGNLHRVFVESNLDRWVGLVTDTTAYDSSKTKIGEVGSLGSARGSLADPSIFAQVGMEPLIGQPTGPLGAFMRLPGLGWFSYMHPMNPFFWLAAVVIGMTRIHFGFKADHSPGFEMTKSGPSNRFRVSIHDTQVNRLLVFACFISQQDSYGYSSPKKFLTEFASNFDPASWKGPKAMARKK